MLDRALEYVEKYGIIDYTMKGKNLIYYTDHREYVGQKTPTTYKAVVNLETMREARTRLKKHNKRGLLNYGK